LTDFDVRAGDGQWVNYVTTATVSWGSPWTFSPGAIYTSGHQYQVKCYAIDQANNLQPVPDDTPGSRTRTFYYDNTIPVSRVTIPADSSVRSDNLLTISGTCNNDPPPAGQPNAAGMGAGKIQVLISKGNDGLFWDNANKSWIASQIWNDASQVGGGWGSWTLAVSSPTAFDNGVSHVIRSRAIDGALDIATELPYSGNQEFNATLVGSSVTFVFDNIAPNSYIQLPTAADSRVNTLATISGTTSDNVAVRPSGGLEINICENVGSSPYKIWDGGNWVNKADQAAQEETWVPIESFGSYNYSVYTTSTNWWVKISTNSGSDGQTYRIRTRARDKSVNTTTAGIFDVTLSTRTVTYDITAPNSVLTSPAPNSYVNNPVLTTIAGTCSGTWASTAMPGRPARRARRWVRRVCIWPQRTSRNSACCISMGENTKGNGYSRANFPRMP
jgi:hypothetical protein